MKYYAHLCNPDAESPLCAREPVAVVKLDGRLSRDNMKEAARRLALGNGYRTYTVQRGITKAIGRDFERAFHVTIPAHVR